MMMMMMTVRRRRRREGRALLWPVSLVYYMKGERGRDEDR